MRKLLILGITTLSLSLVMPGVVQAEEINTTVTSAQFEEKLKYASDIITMYAIKPNVNIRREPNTESEILDHTLLNTSFEVVVTLSDWSMITTEDGYGYICNKYLSEIPIQNKWNYMPSNEEKELIYRIVMLESGTESDLGQQAVTEVIMNMTLYSDLGGRDIKKVLSQKNQFSTWKCVNSTRATPSQRVIDNVEYVLSGNTDILPFKTIYFSRKAQNNRIQIIIGKHVFCNR